MYSLYKPSGKMSVLFILYLVLSIVIIIPIFSYLQALILLHSPFTIFSLILMLICVYLMVLICECLCIGNGKLRNKTVATVFALFIGLLFSFLSTVFWGADGKIDIILKNIESIFLNPVALLNSIEQVIGTGFVLSGTVAQISVTVRGTWLIIITSIGILIMQIFIISSYRARVGEPFIEQKQQWSKRIELKFEFITNKAKFIEKISSEDFYYIDELVLQNEENKSYCIFELYPMDTYYCLSVNNQKADKSDKNGRVTFELEPVVKYLIISKSAGSMLLAKKQINEFKY